MRSLRITLLIAASWGTAVEAQAPDTLRLPPFYREPMERHAQRISETDSLRIMVAGQETIVRRPRLVAGGIVFMDPHGALLPDSLGPGMRITLSIRTPSTGYVAIWGGIVGGGLGILVGNALAHFCIDGPCPPPDRPLLAMGLGALVFGAVGAGIGALIGSTGERWKTIHDSNRPPF